MVWGLGFRLRIGFGGRLQLYFNYTRDPEENYWYVLVVIQASRLCRYRPYSQ